MSLSQARTINSKTSPLAFSGLWRNFSKYGLNSFVASNVNCGGSSSGLESCWRQKYMRSGVAIRKKGAAGSLPCAKMFRRNRAAQSYDLGSAERRGVEE